MIMNCGIGTIYIRLLAYKRLNGLKYLNTLAINAAV